MNAAMLELDRHALVVSVWLPAGLVAATLLHLGLGRGDAGFILAGFGAIVAGLVGHVIVNAALGTDFSVRELVLGLVLYAAALLVFGVALLTAPAFAHADFLPMAGGFMLLFAAVVVVMLTRAGTRGAFAAFDVVRSFRAGDRTADEPP